MRNTEQGRLVGGPLWPMDERSGPELVPGLPHDEWLRVQLFQRRTVMLAGELDDQTANAVAMALMTLDADGDDAVHLRIDSGGGSVACALALMDVIDLLGVPVHAVCQGQAVGPAAGVLAVCPRRILAPHARLGILEPTAEFGGTGHQIEQAGIGARRPVDCVLHQAGRSDRPAGRSHPRGRRPQLFPQRPGGSRLRAGRRIGVARLADHLPSR